MEGGESITADKEKGSYEKIDLKVEDVEDSECNGVQKTTAPGTVITSDKASTAGPQGGHEKSISFKPIAHPEEKEILMEFFNSANGPEWKNKTNWGTDRHVCDWHGIAVNRQTYRITKIHLSMNNITGKLPVRFMELPELVSISLSHNNMSGTLPKEWSALTNMQYISLVKNNIEGNLPPEWGAMTKVFLLDLAHNKLVGKLPAEWSAMKKLRQLRLSHNKLSGDLPQKWKNLNELTFVQLQGNELQGSSWTTFFTNNCTVVVDSSNRNFWRECCGCIAGGCWTMVCGKQEKKPYYNRGGD